MPLSIYTPSPTVVVLGQSAAQLSHTGDTNEVVLATVAIPAGAIGANGVLHVSAHWSATNNGNNKTMTVRFGLAGAGTGATVLGQQQQLSFAQFHGIMQIANRGATNSQVSSQGNMNTSLSGAAVSTAAIDTTQACEIPFTVQLAVGTDTINLEAYQVLLYPHA